MTIAPGALAGIRVLDLSRILGGPYCGQILGDHGADVLKVEPPGGDDTRTWGPPFRDGVASYYHGLNRNKRVQHLDLSDPAEREKLLALVADADVLVENFKTGTMERWASATNTCANASRASSGAASRASAPTARWARCRATTPPCRP